MEGKKIERSPFRMRSRSGSSRCATAIDAAVTSEKPDERAKRARKATWLMRGGEKNRERGALDKVMKKRTSRRRRRNRNRKGKKRRKKRRQKKRRKKRRKKKKGPPLTMPPLSPSLSPLGQLSASKASQHEVSSPPAALRPQKSAQVIREEGKKTRREDESEEKKNHSSYLGIVRCDFDLGLFWNKERQRRPRRAPHSCGADTHRDRHRQRARHKRPPPRRRGLDGRSELRQRLVVARAQAHAKGAAARLFGARRDDKSFTCRVRERARGRRERHEWGVGVGRGGGPRELARRSGRWRGSSRGGGGSSDAEERRREKCGGRRRGPARRQAALGRRRRRQQSDGSSSSGGCLHLDGDRRRGKLLLLLLLLLLRPLRRFGSWGVVRERDGFVGAGGGELALLVGACARREGCRCSSFSSSFARRILAAAAVGADRGRALHARGRHLCVSWLCCAFLLLPPPPFLIRGSSTASACRLTCAWVFGRERNGFPE